MLDLSTARALITTSLSDADLTDVIGREESWLARRIGPLEDERVETFISADGDEVLQLQRPTSSVSVTDDGGAVTAVDLRGWSDIIRTTGSWTGDVLVTYTPSDEDEVISALITLTRLTINQSPYQSQGAAGYTSVVSDDQQKAQRYRAWRGLLRPRQPTTTRLRSAIPAGGNTIVAVSAEASGS